jgi:drug/metabolite transporter (DMT)-like permease
MGTLGEIVKWLMIGGWAFVAFFGYVMILAGGFDDDEKVGRRLEVAMYSTLHTMISVYLPLYVAIN